ncbi:glycoside hydrolase family 19 protein [Pseudomonas sp. KU26590]|uniref:glycoside hydrolase family 19 protein n=1 Tax=Pseudomonas sp. KU26590 TaxID=2991051 RepID=UPI00223E54D5|nr:glycoside hydrolase family 19 protein [Pseudomonas sp. KU26590]UZJ58541.1 glycoside hydrolase family 19 protein [Pseudomonas sp. KU26590]
MPMTTQQLLQILPNAGPQAGIFVSALSAAMGKYQITTPARSAAFIAQVGHESAQLTAVVENLNYSAQALQKTWPSRFSAEVASACARQPEKIANIAYASRMGNGALGSGDGWKYRGRGLIQVTGKSNYQKCGDALGMDLITKPELLQEPANAAMSAAWFWYANGLNALADAGDLQSITRKINGGLNGYADRAEIYERALKVLG